MARPRSSTLAPPFAQGAAESQPDDARRLRSALSTGIRQHERPPLLDACRSIWAVPDPAAAPLPTTRHASIDMQPLTAAAQRSSSLSQPPQPLHHHHHHLLRPTSPLPPSTSGPSTSLLSASHTQPPAPRIGRDRASTLAAGAAFLHDSPAYSLAYPPTRHSDSFSEHDSILAPAPTPATSVSSVSATQHHAQSPNIDPMARRASAGPLFAPTPPALGPSRQHMASQALWNRLGHLVSSAHDNQPGARRRAASMMGPPESLAESDGLYSSHASVSVDPDPFGIAPDTAARRYSALALRDPSPPPTLSTLPSSIRYPEDCMSNLTQLGRTHANSISAFASAVASGAPYAPIHARDDWPGMRLPTHHVAASTGALADAANRASSQQPFVLPPFSPSGLSESRPISPTSPRAAPALDAGPYRTNECKSLDPLSASVNPLPPRLYPTLTFGSKASAGPATSSNKNPYNPWSKATSHEDETFSNDGKASSAASGPDKTLPSGMVAPSSVAISVMTAPPSKPSSVPAPDPAASPTSLSGTAATGPPPVRALWLGTLPPHLTTSALTTLFSRWGALEGTRVLSIKNCAFVNFVQLEDAVAARNAVAGTRWDAWDHALGLGLGLDTAGFDAGVIKIGFAKATMSTASAPAPSDGSNTEPDAPSTPVKEPTLVKPAAAAAAAEPTDKNVGTTVLSPNDCSAVARERNAAHGLVSASNSIVPSSDRGGVALPPEMAITATLAEQRGILSLLGPAPASLETGEPLSPEAELPASLACDATRPKRFSALLPPPPPASRRYDAAQLRDLRRVLEQPITPGWDVDRCAEALMIDLPSLAADYLGNVIVQRLFERASEPMKLTMLSALAPHLARIGCHKNGTWAAQKVLERIPFQRASKNGMHMDTELFGPTLTLAQQELSLAVESLAPYVPPLLLDQYGNYVVQGLLPFGPPHTDAVFSAFLEQTWEIGQGRFGARSMRALLDHPRVTAQQKRLVALGIVLCAVPLACSSNGAILLHWLLDDPGHLFAQGRRHALLAQRFQAHLAELATHKLGSVALLRLAHQTAEPEVARDLVRSLFESPETGVSTAQNSPDSSGLPSGGERDKPPPYVDIVLDPVHGSQLIAQLLLAPSLEPSARAKYTALARRVAVEHGLTHVPAYRMLAEAVGLLPRSAEGTLGTLPLPPKMARYPAQRVQQPTLARCLSPDY